MSKTYDFIVVGSGPAGSRLASRLAASSKNFSVLLIEAGGDNAEPNLRVDGQRWATRMTPGMNWGYTTVPQEHLNGREIDNSRGKGLGGSSAINFMVYTRGPRADHDEWARRVGDDGFRWEVAQERMKRVEGFNGTVPPGKEKYAKALEETYGTEGPLKLGYPVVWEEGVTDVVDAIHEFGRPLNLDVNDGNPIGIGICVSTGYRGRRSTAADLISNPPDNLTVIINTPVDQVLFDGKTAIGVKSGEQKFMASKEVILSAGALDTPKLLLLSGVGPASELKEHGIESVHDLPYVGKNLRDHMHMVGPAVKRTPGSTDRARHYGDQKAVDAAMVQWEKDGSGPLSVYTCLLPVGYFKANKLYESEEFKALDDDVKKYLSHETVPSYELLSNIPTYAVAKPTEDYIVFDFAPSSTLSTGEVRLRSADPKDAPLIDPRFLSHPFDRHAAIDGFREVLEYLETPAFAKDTIELIVGAKSKSDDDILAHIREVGVSMWHMSGTCKMGKPDDPTACVDTDFRVLGLKGLSVVDMSVAPLMTNCHTQAIAYYLGETAAERLLARYA